MRPTHSMLRAGGSALALGFTAPAFAGVDLSAFVDGPKTLQAGLSGTYQVRLANFSRTDAPLELYLIFAGKLDQTDPPGARLRMRARPRRGHQRLDPRTGQLPRDSS